MKIEELESQLEILKSNVAELESKIAEIKRNENKKIPDVKDIPQVYDFDDYMKVSKNWRRGWFTNNKGKLVYMDIDGVELEGNMLFPTEKLAEIFQQKAQLIADCLLFKWHYDREYVPVWDGHNINWCVAYEHRVECYIVYCNLRHNMVYFSTKEIAEKCAEWLNYKYFGIYNFKEGENNDKE